MHSARTPSAISFSNKQRVQTKRTNNRSLTIYQIGMPSSNRLVSYRARHEVALYTDFYACCVGHVNWSGIFRRVYAKRRCRCRANRSRFTSSLQMEATGSCVMWRESTALSSRTLKTGTKMSFTATNGPLWAERIITVIIIKCLPRQSLRSVSNFLSRMLFAFIWFTEPR